MSSMVKHLAPISFPKEIIDCSCSSPLAGQDVSELLQRLVAALSLRVTVFAHGCGSCNIA